MREEEEEEGYCEWLQATTLVRVFFSQGPEQTKMKACFPPVGKTRRRRSKHRRLDEGMTGRLTSLSL